MAIAERIARRATIAFRAAAFKGRCCRAQKATPCTQTKNQQHTGSLKLSPNGLHWRSSAGGKVMDVKKDGE